MSCRSLTVRFNASTYIIGGKKCQGKKDQINVTVALHSFFSCNRMIFKNRSKRLLGNGALEKQRRITEMGAIIFQQKITTCFVIVFFLQS